MNTQNIPISKLQCNEGQVEGLPRNPRFIKDERFEKLKKSLQDDPEMLELRELIVYPHGNKFVVIGGNMRLRAAKQLGFKDMPCKVLPEDTPIEKLKAYTIKDNNAFGNDDFDLLANEWDVEFLEECGFEFDTAEEQEAKVESIEQVKEDDFDEDIDPTPSRVKQGEVWKLGEHRLICGDSTLPETFTKLLHGKETRMCVTSPPYGVGKSYEEYGIEPWRETIFKVIDNITKHTRIIVWNIGDLYSTGNQFIEPTSMYSTQKMKECGFGLMYARIWKKQGGNFAGVNPYYTVTMKPVQEYEWILGYAKENYERDYAQIIEWLKNNARMANLNNTILKEITGAGHMFGHWFTTHQWTMIDRDNYSAIQNYCKENGISAFDKEYDVIRREYEDRNIFGKILSKEEESEWGHWGVWDIATVHHRTGGHPAEFPIELPSRCIKMHSRKGDAILEPFCGAGTTLIAAEQLGRVCYGVELDPHYCDVIIARWEKMTGQQAVKIMD